MPQCNAGHRRPRAVRTRSVARVAGALLVGAVGALGLGSPAYAAPVRYIERIPSAPGGMSASGSLGTIHFGHLASDCTTPASSGDVTLTFWFYGDTGDIDTFTSPVAGAEILQGKSYVRVTDSVSQLLLAQGQFLDADRVFVSADNKNNGVGFGSSGAAPGTTGFPGQVAYPYAQLKTITPITLRDDVDISAYATSCVGFPAACGVPLHLATTAGDLVLCPVTTQSKLQVGRFTARIGPPEYFLAFTRVSFEIVRGATAAVHANFQLAPVSDGIDPAAEAVTLALGTPTLDVPLTLAIPAGSFHQSSKGTYAFDGTVGDAAVTARIAPQGGGSWSFQLDTTAPLGLTGPVTVGLTIGNDTGTAPAAAASDADD